MSKKSPQVDFGSLVSESAAPMPEASQRSAPPASQSPPEPARAAPAPKPKPAKVAASDETKTANLKPLTFKVPAPFRQRFKKRAVEADLKMNALLFEALEAWEQKHRIS